LTDFRTELYERYVSTFKAADAAAVDVDSEAAVAGFVEWCEGRYGPILEELPRDAPILELGCGQGDMLSFLRQAGFSDVRGIDLSAEQVAIARRRGLDAEVADVFEFLADESARERYRVIVAVDILEHFSKDELMRLVPAIRDALEPGGWLLAQTPNGEGLFPSQVIYGDLTHLTIFTPGSLRQLLRLFGFEEFRFYETGPVARGVTGRLRALAWRCIKAALNLVRMIEAGKTQSIWTETLILRCTRP
jgi:2-polyprenyl-3-methyl-5-hydroxy-6-metoxy-1,4-benzoquinol methylase